MLPRHAVASRAIPTTNTLYKVHDALCYVGVVRLSDFVKMKNLLYSIDEHRQIKLVVTQTQR